MRLFLSVGFTALLAAFTLSATAFAENDPTDCVYFPKTCNQVVKGVSTDQATSAAKPVTATTGLPFTGTDVTLLLAGGVLFGLIGYGMRRSGRDNSS